jgi:hypothetical protein
VDEQGNPYPKRITGTDVLPSWEHDVLMAIDVAKLWKITPDEAVDSLSASEFMRRVAIVRAASWDQPTPSQISKNRHERRIGKR